MNPNKTTKKVSIAAILLTRSETNVFELRNNLFLLPLNKGFHQLGKKLKFKGGEGTFEQWVRLSLLNHTVILKIFGKPPLP
jgi:hypothetical protein